MFSRYTERAQRTIVNAQATARELGFDFVGTEHLLLALLKDQESLAVRTLGVLRKDAGQLRASLTQMIGRGHGKQPDELLYTPRLKKVLVELAFDEAQGLGHRQVGTEHLLLGLIREGEGLAAVALDKIGVDLAGARRAVREVTSPAGTGSAASALSKPQENEFDRVVSLIRKAQNEAFQLGAREVSHEHLLMAILADPGAADLADMLKVRGVSLEWLRDQYRDAYGEEVQE